MNVTDVLLTGKLGKTNQISFRFPIDISSKLTVITNIVRENLQNVTTRMDEVRYQVKVSISRIQIAVYELKENLLTASRLPNTPTTEPKATNTAGKSNWTRRSVVKPKVNDLISSD